MASCQSEGQRGDEEAYEIRGARWNASGLGGLVNRRGCAPGGVAVAACAPEHPAEGGRGNPPSD